MSWSPFRFRSQTGVVELVGSSQGGGGGSSSGAVRWLDPIRVSAFAAQTISPENFTVDGGTFTLTYGGDTTDPIAWDASASAVKAALEALTSITGTVTVTGDAINEEYAVVFDDLSEATELLAADGSALTGPDAPYTLDVTVSPVVFPIVTLADGDSLEDIQWYTPTIFNGGSPALDLSDDADDFGNASGKWRPTGRSSSPIPLAHLSFLDDFGVQDADEASSLVAWLTAQTVANSGPDIQYAPAPAVAAVTLYGRATPDASTQGVLWIRAKVARAA